MVLPLTRGPPNHLAHSPSCFCVSDKESKARLSFPKIYSRESPKLLMGVINDYTNRIIHGDCIEVMKSMPERCVDLIATDPPYLVSYQSRDGRRIANDANSE